MAYSNIALFAALLPAVFAMPQHAHMGHAQHKARGLPSAFPTGVPYPSGVPYPGGNSTIIGATGTSVVLSTGGAGSGPVTIRSTIQIVPLPASTSAGAIDSSPSTGSGGNGDSPASGSSGSGSDSGSGQNGESCAAGPYTVTITQANTVTVTVPAPSGGSGGSPSEAPVQSLPGSSSLGQAPSSAPFPVGNSSVPAGLTGTGTAGVSLTSVSYQAPIVSSTPITLKAASSASAAEQSTSASASAQPASVQSAPAQSASVQAYSSPVEAPASNAPASGAASPAKLNVAPVADKPQKSSSSSAAIASSVTPSVAPASSSAAASTSTAPVSHGGKARGLLFGGNNGQMTPAAALSAANTYLSASGSAVGWVWNWDSSPSPAIGWATGDTNVEFVPMLWGLGEHVKLWEKNVATTKPSYVMGFNEPDMTTDKGGCGLGVSDAVKGWKDNMEPLKSSGIKLVTPGTTNELTASSMGLGYMTQFLSACSGCHFDALAFHYYGSASDIESLKATVKKYQALQQQHSIAELWITEMAPTEAPTADQMSAFLKFLDDPSNGVARYAFNGLNTGNGQSLTGPVIKAAYQA